jgi:hypothetical protein
MNAILQSVVKTFRIAAKAYGDWAIGIGRQIAAATSGGTSSRTTPLFVGQRQLAYSVSSSRRRLAQYTSRLQPPK